MEFEYRVYQLIPGTEYTMMYIGSRMSKLEKDNVKPNVSAYRCVAHGQGRTKKPQFSGMEMLTEALQGYAKWVMNLKKKDAEFISFPGRDTLPGDVYCIRFTENGVTNEGYFYYNGDLNFIPVRNFKKPDPSILSNAKALYIKRSNIVKHKDKAFDFRIDYSGTNVVSVERI